MEKEKRGSAKKKTQKERDTTGKGHEKKKKHGNPDLRSRGKCYGTAAE